MDHIRNVNFPQTKLVTCHKWAPKMPICAPSSQVFDITKPPWDSKSRYGNIVWVRVPPPALLDMRRHRASQHVKQRHNLATFTSLEPAYRDLPAREFPDIPRQTATAPAKESQYANMGSGAFLWRQKSPNSRNTFSGQTCSSQSNRQTPIL